MAENISFYHLAAKRLGLHFGWCHISWALENGCLSFLFWRKMSSIIQKKKSLMSCQGNTNGRDRNKSTTVKSEETKGFNKSDFFFPTHTVASMSTNDKNYLVTLEGVGTNQFFLSSPVSKPPIPVGLRLIWLRSMPSWTQAAAPIQPFLAGLISEMSGKWLITKCALKPGHWIHLCGQKPH